MHGYPKVSTCIHSNKNKWTDYVQNKNKRDLLNDHDYTFISHTEVSYEKNEYSQYEPYIVCINETGKN